MTGTYPYFVLRKFSLTLSQFLIFPYSHPFYPILIAAFSPSTPLLLSFVAWWRLPFRPIVYRLIFRSFNPGPSRRLFPILSSCSVACTSGVLPPRSCSVAGRSGRPSDFHLFYRTPSLFLLSSVSLSVAPLWCMVPTLVAPHLSPFSLFPFLCGWLVASPQLFNNFLFVFT